QSDRMSKSKSTAPTTSNDLSDQIPLHKLRRNFDIAVARRNSSAAKAAQFIVLVGTGSFNPVHRMHIQMFELSRRYFERNPFTYVIAGFISPSHDAYVRRKLDNEW